LARAGRVPCAWRDQGRNLFEPLGGRLEFLLVDRNGLRQVDPVQPLVIETLWMVGFTTEKYGEISKSRGA
jgi:hypothetical protein